MNALVKKEIRLILPAWVLAMALAIFPVWLLWPGSSFTPVYGWNVQAPGALVYGPFALGVLLLGLASFGHEFNYGTFSILLAQPISRRRLWATKTMTVGLALLIVFVALCVSDSIRVVTVVGHLKASDWQRALDQVGTRKLVLGIIQGIYDANLYGTLVYGGLSVIAAFSGGLWTNLLFRNTSAAFWLSLLVPTGLWMLAQGVFGPVGLVAQTALIATLVLYSAAGFFWAKKYFLHVQDVQWTGGIVSFPTWSRSRAASSEGAIARKHKPLRALLWKEIQFQQVNLFIGSLLFVTHLIDLAVRKLAAGYFLQHHQAAMIWESWPLLWLAMPFLIGAVSVAEERKLGTLETLLCLPTKRRREFIVKFTTAVALGILLGGIMPVLVECLGSVIGVKSGAGTLAVNWTMVSQVRALLIGSAALVVLAFYASSLTRNLLAALGLTVVLAAAAYFLVVLIAWGGATAVRPLSFSDSRWHFFSAVSADGYEVALWGRRLPVFTFLPMMTAALAWLSFAHFKRLHAGSRIWLGNLLVLIAALLGSAVVTTATYHRVWEIWMPDEPAHRGAQMVVRSSAESANAFSLPQIDSKFSRVGVVLPTGRLWLQQKRSRFFDSVVNGRHLVLYSERWGLHSGFLPGTNWQGVATAGEGSFAIQRDGSLWDLSGVIPGTSSHQAKRVGSDSDWKTLASSENYFLALKQDGTLWSWGSLITGSGTNLSIERIAVPRQVGTDHDWIAVSGFPYNDLSVAMKRNGTLWRYGLAQEHVSGTWTNRLISEPEFWLYGPGGEPRSISFNWRTLLLVLKDGSLWVSPEPARPDHQMVRWGNDSDWLDAGLFGGQLAVGIKRNYSLWVWSDFSQDGRSFGAEPKEVSRYQDWIAVCPSVGGFLALALDGSLCQWNLRALDLFPPEFWSRNQLLMPSRIKAKVIADLKP